jgi:hypothetical protein
MRKSSIRKILIILLGHLWVVELTHIYIFAFKFTLRYLQPDINPIVYTGGKFAAGVVDTGGNLPPVSTTLVIPVANLPPVSLIPVVNLELRISPRIFEKI